MFGVLSMFRGGGNLSFLSADTSGDAEAWDVLVYVEYRMPTLNFGFGCLVNAKCQSLHRCLK